ncbi:putative Endonuclease-reverse transcriptase/Reverse transcriptase (RNA-dependent DNA polymerase) [Trypanosoma cruzi]|uniref:Putative Endonuclease-reverse transcriptase/Reverse transcriptase (RNA-dependent DNA polymerase) n=1 Tax=Trypanosoma cruzi TaxID=5693 RepID=A0A2V2X3N0_TRYCR|nr:putative Endonuclease-reverse transcriptase/Reverse transcriptase (RNA-dependent DNA polymerase) [Trypanosoma cruzi]
MAGWRCLGGEERGFGFLFHNGVQFINAPWPVLVRHTPTSKDACTYSVEIDAGLVLLKRVIQCLHELGGRNTLVLLRTDGLSWPQHVAICPVLCDVIPGYLWSIRADTTFFSTRVIMLHIFAHCEDHWGDMVDHEVQEAAKNLQRTHSPHGTWTTCAATGGQ